MKKLSLDTERVIKPICFYSCIAFIVPGLFVKTTTLSPMLIASVISCVTIKVVIFSLFSIL